MFPYMVSADAITGGASHEFDQRKDLMQVTRWGCAGIPMAYYQGGCTVRAFRGPNHAFAWFVTLSLTWLLVC